MSKDRDIFLLFSPPLPRLSVLKLNKLPNGNSSGLGLRLGLGIRLVRTQNKTTKLTTTDRKCKKIYIKK